MKREDIIRIYKDNNKRVLYFKEIHMQQPLLRPYIWKIENDTIQRLPDDEFSNREKKLFISYYTYNSIGDWLKAYGFNYSRFKPLTEEEAFLEIL